MNHKSPGQVIPIAANCGLGLEALRILTKSGPGWKNVAVI